MILISTHRKSLDPGGELPSECVLDVLNLLGEEGREVAVRRDSETTETPASGGGRYGA